MPMTSTSGGIHCGHHTEPSRTDAPLFVTLEDGTSFVNLILWPQVVENFHVLMRTESFLGVSGQLQLTDNVVHIVVLEPVAAAP